MIPPPNYHELTPPLINISIFVYFDKFCRGLEQRATVGKDYAEYLKLQDPKENYYHIEPQELEPGQPKPKEPLFYVYPIQAWRESTERRKRQQETSEKTRAIRFALEQEQLNIKNKILRRRDILCEVVQDATTGPVASKLAKHPKDFVEYLCYRALLGENPAVAEKLGIDKQLIEEFKLLPHDPEFKNKYFNSPIV